MPSNSSSILYVQVKIGLYVCSTGGFTFIFYSTVIYINWTELMLEHFILLTQYFFRLLFNLKFHRTMKFHGGIMSRRILNPICLYRET